MKKRIKYYNILIFAFLVTAGLSCKEKDAKDEFVNEKGSYFSIRQFALDQWNTFAGDPFVIYKVTRIGNGKPDTTLTNTDTIDWTPIFKTFFETDISDRDFLGKYNFTQFDDNADYTHNLFYQAKDEDLFTQKLLITVNPVTTKITGIYIETYKHSLWEDVTQKLYYDPMQTIQIQTDTKPLFGSRKFTVVEYELMR